ncbi:MAG TPA: MFS transporter [Phycisphaerae bacterium]|nr:MFS transporter [Phycisphaerae bacterium]
MENGNAGQVSHRLHRLSGDAWLLNFSAFFADLGYQGVTALFPLWVVLELHRAVYWYGLITGIAFGVGALFAYVGGRVGDRFDKKYVSIAGNSLLPLMALSGLTHHLWASGLLFVLGWWARYFRTPPRRALLVHVTAEEARAQAFGMLHALDIAGGMLSALLAMLFLWLRVPMGRIILYAAVPLVISTVLLLFVKRTKLYTQATPLKEVPAEVRDAKSDRRLFMAMLFAATLYGFSFYNLGFPILTAANGHANRGAYEMGVLAYVLYLGVSAVSGYVLAVIRNRPLRSLWLLGYLPSALASGLIGLSVALHMPMVTFYGAVIVLGLGMGAVETFEPTLTSSLVGGARLSRGMGLLSVSRSLGQFLSNVAMGLLFALSESVPYFYAFAAAMAATLILGVADVRHRRRKAQGPTGGVARDAVA